MKLPFSVIEKHLIPKGYMVLCSEETLVGLRNDYDQTLNDGALFYRKKAEDIPLPRSA